MSKGQMILAGTLVIASMLLFAVSVAWWSNKVFRNKPIPERSNKAGVSTILTLSGFLILSIWMIRFAAGYFAIIVSDVGTQQLSPFEEIINSLYTALRTFSMEEEYDTYIIDIKNLVSAIIPKEHWCSSVIQIVTVVYASLLNFIAPIVGGAIILEILASIFPKIRLRWSYNYFKRPKYYFSELNAASLSLAKSIYYNEMDKKPILIFTDTYVDDEKEKEYELLLEAQKYGAICVRDDLAHVLKTKHGERNYYLMDENEFCNLQTLMELAEDHNFSFIKDSCIYMFVQSDAYIQIEKQIYKEFKTKKEQNLLNEDEMPIIVPVRGYRNLVQNLLVDVPLYEPLIHKKGNTELNITIFGNGIIGTEAFLNSYWFGQMLISADRNGEKTLSECDVTINIVSNDTEEAFWSKIDYINPELKKSVEVLGISTAGKESKLLAYDLYGNTNNPYCRVRYIKADVMGGGFFDGASKDVQKLLASDYFIVALGNDADNISVADKLRFFIGKKHLEETADGAVGNVVIAYAVFNSELAKTLNKQKHYQCRVSGKNDIYMHAFGSLEQVYSCDNVYMSKHKLLAEGTGAAYNKSQMHRMHIEDNKTRNTDENQNYGYWADLARAMHIKYKVFSLGLIKMSIFDYDSDHSEMHTSYVQGKCDLYKQMALSKTSDGICDEDVPLELHILAWLEHRRWIAFTRIMGYRHSSELKTILQLNGNNHKNMELKLHPCLIEAEKPSLNGKNVYIQKDISKLFEAPPHDFKLHELTVDQMISLLNKKKEYLVSRINAVSNIKTDDLDLLDKLTCDWCKVATPVSLTKLDMALKGLEKIETDAATEEARNLFAEGWRGISCYDFKTYDYCIYDYDK